MSLRWNDFSMYPDQGGSIYLRCVSSDLTVTKFVKISEFNAVSFDFGKITEKFPSHNKWHFSWLPSETIEENYDKPITDLCGAERRSGRKAARKPRSGKRNCADL